MIRALSMLAAAAVLGLAGAAAQAGNVCSPDRGEPLRLAGVSGGDRVSVRAGPGQEFRRLGELFPGQRDIRATGRARATTRRCAEACADLDDGFGGGGLAAAIDRECRREGRIWYEVRTSRGLTGWASARWLVLPVAEPPPPRPPRPPAEPDDGVLRFRCSDGDRLALTVTSSGDRGVMTDADGRVWEFERRAESIVNIDLLARVPGGAALLSGTPKSVRWKPPGRDAVLCTRVR